MCVVLAEVESELLTTDTDSFFLPVFPRPTSCPSKFCKKEVSSFFHKFLFLVVDRSVWPDWANRFRLGYFLRVISTLHSGPNWIILDHE